MPQPEWAIVAGAGINGLGLARSLGTHGIRVAVIDSAPGPALHSRFARVAIGDAPYRGSADYLDAIRALGERLGGRPVLFLTQEATVGAWCDAPGLIGERVRHLAPDPTTARMLMSKGATQLRAEAMGFPVPRTVRLAGPEEVSLAASLDYPVVLKPIAKSEEWEKRNRKAYRFDSFAELGETYARIGVGGPPVVVQEWIEGDDTDVYFTLVWRDADGSTRGAFTGRKLRQWPPNVGGTASCIPAPQAAAELEALTKRFFDAVGCRGMASIEYKRDRRTGRFLMVEPTVARTDYQEEVATLNGMNLPYIAYCALTGLPLPPATPPPSPPYIWRDGDSDARSAALQPELRLPPEIAGYRVARAVKRWSDPGPWLDMLGSRLRDRFRG